MLLLAMKITLQAWATRQFDPPPKIATLRSWASSGQIVPPPIKVGRTWMVDEEAEYRLLIRMEPVTEMSAKAARILIQG